MKPILDLSERTFELSPECKRDWIIIFLLKLLRCKTSECIIHYSDLDLDNAVIHETGPISDASIEHFSKTHENKEPDPGTIPAPSTDPELQQTFGKGNL